MSPALESAATSSLSDSGLDASFDRNDASSLRMTLQSSLPVGVAADGLVQLLLGGRGKVDTKLTITVDVHVTYPVQRRD